MRKILTLLFILSTTIIVAQEDIVEKTVPFSVVEKPFIFPGCESESVQKSKSCTMNKISKFINENLNTSIASDLGLEGRIRMSSRFKVDTEGNIFDIKVSAPDPKLKEELERVINLLPKFTPSSHNGEVVITPFSLPILFQVKKNVNNEDVAQSDLWSYNLGRLKNTSTIYINNEDYYLFGRDQNRSYGLEVYRFSSDGNGNYLGNIRNGYIDILSELPESVKNNYGKILGVTYSVNLNKDIININFFSNTSKFELKNGNSIETFNRNGGVKVSKDKAVYFANSTYNNKRYLFIQNISLDKSLDNRVMIDITTNNPYISHNKETFIRDTYGNNRNYYDVISYTNSKGKDYVVFSTQKTRIFYYIIKNGIVEKINYTEFKDTEHLEKVYFLENSGVFINQIKDSYKCYNCIRLEAIDEDGKKVWGKKINNFYTVNSIVENNANIVVGGSSTKVGYLGYPNPYIEILDNKTGNLKTSYFKPIKNTSINNMATLQNNIIIITSGLAEGLSTREDTSEIKITVDKNVLDSDGQFSKIWFTKIN